MTVKLQQIAQIADVPHPLGRHVEHDEMSRDYPARAAAPADVVSVRWKRRRPPFDQGNLGSCTGNAMAGVLITSDAASDYRHWYTERTAVRLYERATVLDGFPGTYPPDDTGSSGLGVAKAALERGDILSYSHAFSIDAAIGALMYGPVITGITWDESMFNPDSNGQVHPDGNVAGGHEFEVVGWDAERDLAICANSWTPQWGPLGGYFLLSKADWAAKLEDDGDVTQFVRKHALLAA